MAAYDFCNQENQKKNYNRNNNYLHPYYYPQWNNPLSVNNNQNNNASAYTNVQPRQRPQFSYQYKSPSSPVGLTEVLTSYRPGPTVIMIEKKRPSIFRSPYFRLLCIILALLILAVFMWTRILPSDEPEIQVLQPLQEPLIIQRAVEGECENNSLACGSERRSFNILLSIDDDEESFLEHEHVGKYNWW